MQKGSILLDGDPSRPQRYSWLMLALIWSNKLEELRERDPEAGSKNIPEESQSQD